MNYQRLHPSRLLDPGRVLLTVHPQFKTLPSSLARFRHGAVIAAVMRHSGEVVRALVGSIFGYPTAGGSYGRRGKSRVSLASQSADDYCVYNPTH